MQEEPTAIASLCCKHYASVLRSAGKPEGHSQWTPMAAVVIKHGTSYEVVSMATGSKCLGAETLRRAAFNGKLVHDCHAEVLARRALVRYLYTELLKAEESVYFTRVEDGTFSLKSDVTLHMFITSSPCGDCSIFIQEDTRKRHRSDDVGDGDVSECKVTKYDFNRTGAKCVPNGRQDERGEKLRYHTALGELRLKPGRGDPSASMSCSDKMMRWQCVGLQGSLLKHFIRTPLRFTSIIIDCRSPHDMGSLRRGLLRRHPDTAIYAIDVDFTHRQTDQRSKVSPNAIVWYEGIDKQEVLVKGFKQGWTQANREHDKALSTVCKFELFKLFTRLKKLEHLSFQRYVEFKLLGRDASYEDFFSTFPNWIKTITES